MFTSLMEIFTNKDTREDKKKKLVNAAHFIVLCVLLKSLRVQSQPHFQNVHQIFNRIVVQLCIFDEELSEKNIQKERRNEKKEMNTIFEWI